MHTRTELTRGGQLPSARPDRAAHGHRHRAGLGAAGRRPFRDHHDDLAAEIARRLLQTNEVGRCSFLRPAIQAAALRVDAPLALLEVGASAGLNLLLDRYGYRYHRRDGETSPAVVVDERPGDPVLDCALDGPGIPPLDQLLHITWRAGIDLNPLDVADPADRRWLRALVWPDHRTRAVRLDTALQVAPPGSSHRGL